MKNENFYELNCRGRKTKFMLIRYCNMSEKEKQKLKECNKNRIRSILKNN